MSKWSQQRKCVSHLNPIITYYIIITTNSSLDGPQYCFTYLIYSEHPPHQAQSFCDLWVYVCLLIMSTGKALQEIRDAEHIPGATSLWHPRLSLLFFNNISSSFCLWKVSRCYWYGCNQKKYLFVEGSQCIRCSSWQSSEELLTGYYRV